MRQVSGLTLWPMSAVDMWCQSCKNAYHSIVTWMPLYCHSDNISTQLPLDVHSTATWLECQLTANPVSLTCHLSATWILKTTNGVSLKCHWNANWLSMECHSTATESPIDCQWNVTRVPLEWQWTVSRMQMDCHLNVNCLPMECQCQLTN